MTYPLRLLGSFIRDMYLPSAPWAEAVLDEWDPSHYPDLSIMLGCPHQPPHLRAWGH